MADNKTLRLEIVVDDKGTPVVKGFAGEVDKAANAMDSKAHASTKKLDGAMGKLDLSFGKVLKSAVAFSTGLLGIQTGMAAVGKAFDVMKSFEAELSNVDTLLKNSPVSIQQLRKEILALSPALGSSTELTKGLYQALSAGVEPAKAVKFVGDAAKLAKAGLTETDTAVKVLTATMDAYGLGAEEAGMVSDTLFTTVRLGKTTMDELANSIGTVLPIASTMGISFKEATATVTTLTKVFPSTSEAVTGLRSALSNMLQNTDKFKTAGIDLKAVIAKDGLTGAIEALKTATGGSAEKVRDFVPDVQGLTAVLALMGAQLKTQKHNLQEFQHVAGATDEAYAKSQKNLTAAMNTLGNTIERLVQQHAPPLLDALSKIATFLSKNLEPAFQDVKAVIEALSPLWNAFGAAFQIVNAAINKSLEVTLGTLSLMAAGASKVTGALGFEGVSAKLANVSNELRIAAENSGELASQALKMASDYGKAALGIDQDSQAIQAATEKTGKTLQQILAEEGVKSVEELRAKTAELPPAVRETVPAVQEVQQAIVELPEKTKPALDQLVTNMAQAGQDAGAAFKNSITSAATQAMNEITSVIEGTRDIITRSDDGTYTNANGLNGPRAGSGASGDGAPDATQADTPDATTPAGRPAQPPETPKTPPEENHPTRRIPPTSTLSDAPDDERWIDRASRLGRDWMRHSLGNLPPPIEYTFADTREGLLRQLSDISREMTQITHNAALVGRDSRLVGANNSQGAFLTRSRDAWNVRRDDALARLEALDPEAAQNLRLGNVGGGANGRRILELEGQVDRLMNGDGLRDTVLTGTTRSNLSRGGGVSRGRVTRAAWEAQQYAGYSGVFGGLEYNQSGASYTRAGEVLRPGNGEVLLSKDLAEGLRQLVAQGGSQPQRSVVMNSPSFTVEVNGVDARAIDARGLAQALAPAMRELIRRGELQLA